MDIRQPSPSIRLAGLIEAVAARRDRAAFAELFDYYAPRIKALLMRSGTPPGQAEDLAQEAMLAVWRKAGQFDRSRASPSAWIYTIARNLRVDAFRRDVSAAALAAETLRASDEPMKPDTALEIDEREKRVRFAMQRLTPDQITVVELSFFHGKAHGDIAKELALPLGTVKSRVRSALKQLRKHLGDLS
jgi:RNA polymerase sigma-70 factor (ECF subfamily)